MDIYACCGVHIVAYPVNTAAPQFVTHGLSNIDTLKKSAGIWSPTTRFRKFLDVTHWSAADYALGKSTAVGYTVGAKLDYSEEKYKTNFEIWREIITLQFEHKNIESSQPTLDLTPVGSETL